MALIPILLQLAVSLPLLYISHLLWLYLRSPLKHIPGPFWAKFTNIWRFWNILGGQSQRTHQQLHDRYGPAVRLGPNFVSLSDPSLIRVIYDTRGTYVKSDFYASNDVQSNGKLVSNIFNTRSNEFHTMALKPIKKYYAMKSVLEHEPLLDETITTFVEKLDQNFANTGKVCDLDDWLLYCAWDMMSQTTFSAPIGFLEAGGDVEGILASVEKDVNYFAVISQMPVLDFFLDKNPLIKFNFHSQSYVVTLSFNRIMARLKENQANPDRKPNDFLNHYLDEQAQNEQVDVGMVLGWLLVNMFGGADTTAITMRTIVYYVLKNPEIHQKLRAALKEADLVYPIAYHTVKDLAYLTAVIYEAIRIHPALALHLERIVPSEGLRLPDGRFLPAKTIVGMNAWVVNADRATHGSDTDRFRPERWLQRDDETVGEWEDRKWKMRESDLTFGAGKRVCLGKDVSMVELYKLTATMFDLYEMHLENPAREWHYRNYWMTHQSGLRVGFKRDLTSR